MPLKITHLCKKDNSEFVAISSANNKISSIIIVYISGTVLSNLYIINLFNPQYFTSLACCCSVGKSYPTLCDPIDCSTPDFPALYCLLEFSQTHIQSEAK